MKKFIKKLFLVLLLLLILLVMLISLFYFFGDNFLPSTTVNAPKRVRGIPRDAVWSGGIDGGNWLRCRQQNNTKRYACEIFHDYTGDLITKGMFVSTSKKNLKDLWKSFKFYDGDIIYFPNGEQFWPHGWILHPDVKKKQKYNMGKKLTEEVQLREAE